MYIHTNRTLLALMVVACTPPPPAANPTLQPVTAPPLVAHVDALAPVNAIPLRVEREDEPPTLQSEGDDPLKGVFSLADATEGLHAGTVLVALISTSKGTLLCKLLRAEAPMTVANFVGLARGVRPWKDPSGVWVKKPLYDGTIFHRVIPGFMIQAGDPLGTGKGEPGYQFADENTAAKHDRAGLLCMANSGPNTNGAQFFITDGPAPHLDGSFPVFGDCGVANRTVHDIANVKAQGKRPVTPVLIRRVRIEQL
jgi:peptidyl-prolyl cis-trans isomerase A (cyclophilin A)